MDDNTQLRQDIEELRILADSEVLGGRKRLFERLLRTCEKELADRTQSVASAAVPAPATRPGYELRRFVVFTDGQRCEALSMYRSDDGTPITRSDTANSAQEMFNEDFDWDNAVQTIVEAWVRVPSGDDAEVVEGVEIG